MAVVPPPRTQKFTWEELWRIGFLRSPGSSTEMLTAMPGASPWPTPVAGFTTYDTRRPFAGRGSEARRSTSAAIASLGITTGEIRSPGFAASPVRSTNLYSLGCISSSCLSWSRVCGLQLGRNIFRLGKLAPESGAASLAVNVDRQGQVGNPHAQRFEKSEIIASVSGVLAGNQRCQRQDPLPLCMVRAEGLDKLARQSLRLWNAVGADQRGTRDYIGREFGS